MNIHWQFLRWWLEETWITVGWLLLICCSLSVFFVFGIKEGQILKEKDYKGINLGDETPIQSASKSKLSIFNSNVTC
jgi:hypothetical protein